MATYLGTSAVFEVRSAATAGNLGGGGFNPANTHFISNWTATSANTASPVLSSASYNFVAGDVGAWVYVKSGTNWTPGWYQIASVAANAATLSAGIGAAIQISNGRYITNTVAGCATTASPTSGNIGIDYSQQNAAQFTNSVLTGTTTACTDATAPFAAQHAGNFICISSGTGVTAGWYEIVSVSAGTATLDRTAGTSYSACTYYLGGAVSLGGSTTGITDAIFFALGSNSATTGCRTFIKGGATYTPSAAVSYLTGNVSWPSIFEGYNSLRGDLPTIDSGNQPIINMAATIFTAGQYSFLKNITFKGTSTSVVLTGGNNQINYCKATNTSTTAARFAFNDSTNINSIFLGCEAVSYGGVGINGANGSTSVMIGCYAHDCGTYGISALGNNVVINCIVASCKSGAVTCNAGPIVIYGNTLYGAENKLGIGINGPYSPGACFNNILYGFVSGYGGSTTSFGTGDYNTFNNNTNDIAAGNTGSFKGANDVTTAPSFTSVAQVTGTTATSSGTTLTDSGKNFTTAGVVAGRDYLYVVSGTGQTNGIYGITVVGTTTLTTDNTIGTNGTGDLTYQITTGRNFGAGSALNNLAFPSAFPAALTTGYVAIGAVQSKNIKQNSRIFGRY